MGVNEFEGGGVVSANPEGLHIYRRFGNIGKVRPGGWADIIVIVFQ